MRRRRRARRAARRGGGSTGCAGAASTRCSTAACRPRSGPDGGAADRPLTGDPVVRLAARGPAGARGDRRLARGGARPGRTARLRLWSLSLDLPGRDAVDLSADTAGLDLASPGGSRRPASAGPGVRGATASVVHRRAVRALAADAARPGGAGGGGGPGGRGRPLARPPGGPGPRAAPRGGRRALARGTGPAGRGAAPPARDAAARPEGGGRSPRRPPPRPRGAARAHARGAGPRARRLRLTATWVPLPPP